MAYITFEKSKDKIVGKGPISKFFSGKGILELLNTCNITEKDSVFFVCNKISEAIKFSGIVRQKIAEELNLIDKTKFSFCWIVDYPMYIMMKKKKKLILVTILFDASN